MILLVSGATATLRSLPADAPVGHLVTPHTGNRIAGVAATGRPWAADNGCYGGLDERAMLAMLRQIDALPHGGPLWVAVPDVVADAAATLALWRTWRHTITSYVGWRGCAFVAQDGSDAPGMIPWDRIGCLFIGGTTAFKESAAAAGLVRHAKMLGKRVHVGRVNTERRVRLFDGLGIDSIDGTQFSMFPDTYVPRWMERMRPSLRGQLAPPPPALPMFEEIPR